jgi:anti-anti-sigma regulatory factor
VRCSGVCSSVRGLGPHDHVCVPYDDGGELRREIVGYLRDGRRLGQRLMYVGSSPEEQLRRDLEELGDADRLLADGALQVASLAGVYEVGEPLDAQAQLATYAEATDAAVREGYAGLRVAAEVTDLVAAPEAWDAHVAWEAVADGYMANAPLSAMCCYDRRVLPDAIVADLARVHPVARCDVAVAPFRIFSSGKRDTLMLAGEVDYFNADDLDRLLGLAMPAGSSTVLDLGELRFIDQHGLMRVAKRAGRPEGGPLRVRNVPGPTRRLFDLLGIEV